MGLRLPKRLRSRRSGGDSQSIIANLDEEGVKKLFGELMAANRATQANFDKIEQLFPIQPENISDLMPSWKELEEGGLEPPEGEEGGFGDAILPIEKQGDILVGDEDGNVGVLEVGQTGQVLTVDPSSPFGVSWGGDTTSGPEDNGGENLTPELSKWITVGSVQVNEEEDNNATLEFPYSPPKNCDLVVFCVVSEDAAFSGVSKKLTLAGKEADKKFNNALEFEQCYVYVFFNPPSGNVVITNTGSSQKDYVVLPISFKNQGNTPLEQNGSTSDGFDQDEDLFIESELDMGALPGVSVMMGSRKEQVAASTPPSTSSHSGVKVLDVAVKNGTSNYRVEIAVELVPTGITKRKFEWAAPAVSAFTQRYLTLGVRETPV